MTPLRFVLGFLWLAGALAWMLSPPCMNLWRAALPIYWVMAIEGKRAAK